MRMIKVTNEVNIYEADDREVSTPAPRMLVKSHWNYDKFVVLITPGGERLTVAANDLRAAIENATNTKRF
jgi:hypothetical protein